MTLDSLVSSLGSTSRNVGAHSFILIQQQQVAHQHNLQVGTHKQSIQRGCGGGMAITKCCANRLIQAKEQRTRGVIILSVDHPASHWIESINHNRTHSPLTPCAIIDACSQRFAIASNATTAASSPAASSSKPSISIQTLHSHELKNLHTMRTMIESQAQQFHAQYDVSVKSSPASTIPPSSSTPINPYALESDQPETFICETVTLVIDDLFSLFARFGSSNVLAWLHALKSSPLNISILATLDIDGLATLTPLNVGSGTGNFQASHVSASIHAHLVSLATTTIHIRSVIPLATKVTASSPSSSHSADAFTLSVYLVHKRPSGKVTSVVEEMDVFVDDGLVKKVPGSGVNKSSLPSSTASTASTQPVGSLAQQFGSSFSLDLTSKAKSARAQTVLPYQHTAEIGVSSLDAPEEDDLLSEDDDEDFDDPDDDLEI